MRYRSLSSILSKMSILKVKLTDNVTTAASILANITIIVQNIVEMTTVKI